MPKKKKEESAEAQAKRFEAEAQKLIDAGELDPTAASQGLDVLVSRLKTRSQLLKNDE
jgi:hypothetical protein